MDTEIPRPRFLLDMSRLAVVSLNGALMSHPDLQALGDCLKGFDVGEGLSSITQQLMQLEPIDQVLIIGTQQYIEVAVVGFALLEAGFDVSVMINADTRQAWHMSKLSVSGMLYSKPHDSDGGFCRPNLTSRER